MIYNNNKRSIYKDIKEAAQIEGVDTSIIVLGLKCGTYKYIPYGELQDRIDNEEIDVPITKIIEYRNIPNITINGRK